MKQYAHYKSFIFGAQRQKKAPARFLVAGAFGGRDNAVSS